MVWLAEKDFYVYARLFFLMSQRKCNFNGCIIPGFSSLHSKVRIWIIINVKRSEIIVITKLVFYKHAYNLI